MGTTTTEVKSAAAQVSEQMHAEGTMFARALLHVMGETDDHEAITWLRKRAALGHPSEALRAFNEERERQRIEASRHMDHGMDQSREPVAIRAERYAGLPAWDGSAA